MAFAQNKPYARCFALTSAQFEQIKTSHQTSPFKLLDVQCTISIETRSSWLYGFSCHGAWWVYEWSGIAPTHLNSIMPGGSHGHAVCNSSRGIKLWIDASFVVSLSALALTSDHTSPNASVRSSMVHFVLLTLRSECCCALQDQFYRRF